MPTVIDAINAYARIGVSTSYLDTDAKKHLYQIIDSAQPCAGFYQASKDVVVEERFVPGHLSRRNGFVRALHVRTRIK